MCRFLQWIACLCPMVSPAKHKVDVVYPLPLKDAGRGGSSDSGSADSRIRPFPGEGARSLRQVTQLGMKRTGYVSGPPLIAEAHVQRGGGASAFHLCMEAIDTNRLQVLHRQPRPLPGCHTALKVSIEHIVADSN